MESVLLQRREDVDLGVLLLGREGFYRSGRAMCVRGEMTPPPGCVLSLMEQKCISSAYKPPRDKSIPCTEPRRWGGTNRDSTETWQAALHTYPALFPIVAPHFMVRMRLYERSRYCCSHLEICDERESNIQPEGFRTGNDFVVFLFRGRKHILHSCVGCDDVEETELKQTSGGSPSISTILGKQNGCFQHSVPKIFLYDGLKYLHNGIEYIHIYN